MPRNFYLNSRRYRSSRSRSNSPDNFGHRHQYDPHYPPYQNNHSYYGPQSSSGTNGSYQYSQVHQNQNNFQTPVTGVSPFLYGQLQNNNQNTSNISTPYTNPISGPTPASTMPQNNGYGQSPQQGIFPNPQNFSSASMSTNSQYQIQMNNQSGNLVSTTIQSNLNPNANTFVPNYQNQINIPPVTQVQSPSVEQQNPFTRSANSTPTVSNNGYYNQLQNQISPTPTQNNSNNHQNQFTAQTTNMQFTPLSDSQKYKLNNFHARLREFDNDQDHIRKCRKSDYPEFPQNPDLNYMDWRAAYLMQAQIHNMHLLYDPNHVPAHIMFPLPLPDDPLYEGREELFQAA